MCRYKESTRLHENEIKNFKIESNGNSEYELFLDAFQVMTKYKVDDYFKRFVLGEIANLG
jgi:hypothetical protein